MGAGMKSILVMSLVLSMLLVPSTASFFKVVKCVTFCLLKCGGNPFCAVPCFAECKKAFPLAVDGLDADGDQFLCTTGCAISNCFTTTDQISATQGLTVEEELMKNCVYGCDHSCKARTSNKLE